MGTILSYFNQMCATRYKELGFIKYKAAFARITGDVVQSFELKRFSGGRECTIEFGIVPICSPVPYFLGGPYKLDRFFLENSPWKYDPKSDGSMHNCMTSIIQAIDMYILPLFDACVNCQLAFSGLLKMEEILEKKRQDWLELMHLQDPAKPWQTRSLFDSHKYYMALKLQDWNYVHNYYVNWISSLDEEFTKFSDSNHSELPEYVRRRMKMRDKFEKSLCHLEDGDYELFDEMVKKNEEEFLSYIAQKYPKLLGDKG